MIVGLPTFYNHDTVNDRMSSGKQNYMELECTRARAHIHISEDESYIYTMTVMETVKIV